MQQQTIVDHRNSTRSSSVSSARWLPFLLPLLPVAERAVALGWLTWSPSRGLAVAGVVLGATLLAVWWQRRDSSGIPADARAGRRSVSGVVRR